MGDERNMGNDFKQQVYTQKKGTQLIIKPKSLLENIHFNNITFCVIIKDSAARGDFSPLSVALLTA